MGKEQKDEWVICNFLIEPSIYKKYKAMIALKGYSSVSEALREHIREIVKRFEEEDKHE